MTSDKAQGAGGPRPFATGRNGLNVAFVERDDADDSVYDNSFRDIRTDRRARSKEENAGARANFRIALTTDKRCLKSHQKDHLAGQSYGPRQVLGEPGRGVHVPDADDFLDLAGSHTEDFGPDSDHDIMNGRSRSGPGEKFFELFVHDSI